MEKTVPLSLTIEEAVAEIVNMNYIPAGFTLLDMTSAFQEEAEVEYENALIDRLPEDQLAPLKMRMDSCSSRHTLAQQLLESLQYEVKNPKNSIIVLAKESSSHRRLTRMSVWEWAADRYGIGISMGTNQSNTNAENANSVDPNANTEKSKVISWEDITIKIWKDYKIGFSYKKGEYKRSHFRDIGLIDKRAKEQPNHQGLILIGLSLDKKYPVGKYCKPNEKVAITRLRDALCKLTKLSEDPFLPYNEHEGWKPRFILIDDRENADERAKEKAIHVRFDDETKYTDD